MKLTMPIVCLAATLAGCGSAWAADANPVAKNYESAIGSAKEIVSLAEAMPADKYNFAPKDGELSGVRTFAQQVKHLAAVVYLVSAAAQGEKPRRYQWRKRTGRGGKQGADRGLQGFLCLCPQSRPVHDRGQ